MTHGVALIMAVGSVKRKGKAKDAQIEAKDQRWHCRNRITLVFGSNDVEELDTYVYTEKGIEFKTVQFHQAKSKAIEEILDNCIDEYYRGHVTEVHCYLDKDGKRVTVQDNGIGFPLSKVPQVYSEFRTGSKFKDEEVARKINIKSKADKIVVQTNHEWIILDVEELNKYVLKNKLNKIYLDDITPILEWTIIIKKKVKNG